MEASPEPETTTLCKVLSKRKTISQLKPSTFGTLALIFIFPSSVAAAVICTVIWKISLSTTPIPTNLIVLLPAAVYLLLSLVLTPCAVGSITYTAFRAFHGQPVTLKSAVKSISATYFPLLANQLFAFAFPLFLIISSTLLGLGFLDSPYLLVLATPMFVVLMIYPQVDWTLAGAAVVAESSWGLAPLKRSNELVKGKKGLSLSLSFIYGGFSFLLLLWSNGAGLRSSSRPATAAEWRSFFEGSALESLFTSSFITLLQTDYLVANAVMYVYCRADGGGEFSGEYFSLPVDNELAASLVC